MSNNLFPLLSATFYEPSYTHYVELVHQRDADGWKRLENCEFLFYDMDGREVGRQPVDPSLDVIDLGALTRTVAPSRERIMVMIDSRYDTTVFPYRPHHYGFFHRDGSRLAPVYYAVNAVMGGVPNRIGAVAINNFEVFLFFRDPGKTRYSVMLGNPSRFATAQVTVFTHYGDAALTKNVCTLPPKGHAEVPLEPSLDGRPLLRVELKGLFKSVGYIVGRGDSGDIVHFDHLFAYLK